MTDEPHPDGPLEVYSVFDSPETAEKVTGGAAYHVEGHKGEAFILTDKAGDHFVYARVDCPKYSKIGTRIDGKSFGSQGYNMDHVASASEQKLHGDDYVLMARVPSSVNQSSGFVERTRHPPITAGDKKTFVRKLSKNFNDKGSHRLPDGGKAGRLTAVQLEKLRGRMKADFETFEHGSVSLGPEETEARAALMLDDTRQARIGEMRGERIKVENKRWDSHRQHYDGPDITRGMGKRR